MKKLAPLLLTGCLMTKGDVPDNCPKEVTALEDACREANVIGTNSNPQLDKALEDLRSCAGESVKVTCSDPGFGEPRILTFKK